MIHPFGNLESCAKRLYQEYLKYGSLVIGFDFDNTIYDYHGYGGDYSEIIEILRESKKLGFILCLYTTENNQSKLDWKIRYCEDLGIKPDYVNESPILPGSSKPYFNLLLDDRAGLESAYEILKKVIEDEKLGRT